MEAKVLISFSDNVLAVIHQEGKVIELSEERFEEIMLANENLIEAVKGKEAVTVTQDEIDAVND